MNLDLLLQHFALLIDSPARVKDLRQTILELAVRGKLVAQDASDEPASVLLKKIAAEKKKLIAEGKLKRDKPLPPIREEEIPYELPQGWEWVRLGSITINRDGERIPVSKEIRENLTKTYDYYGASGVIDKIDRYLFEKPLLLIGEDGANLLLRSTPVAFIAHGQYWVNNHAHVLDAIDFTMLRYLENCVNSIALDPYVTGTAQPKLNQAKLNLLRIPLPPLAEQHRIVAQVDALMRLCDGLEAKLAQAEQSQTDLAPALLRTLAEASDQQQRAHAWQRVSEHFDLLLSTPKNVQAMRQTILELAVRGKLLPQDASDEPASVLLKKIAAEKKKLIAEGKLKHDKPLPPICEEDVPYELPQGWEWVRLIETLITLTDGEHLNPSTIPAGIPLLSAKNIGEIELDFTDCKYVSPEDAQLFWKRCRPENGDILVVSRGGGVGRTIIAKSNHNYCLMGSVLLFKPSKLINNQFVYYYLTSSLGSKKLKATSNATAQPAIYIEHLKKNYCMPLPPLAEQHRIVAQVDALMRLCDGLEAKFAQAKEASQPLMQAILQSAMA